MKKNLTKINNELYYFKDNIKIVIDRNDRKTYPPNLTGNISPNLTGNISNLTGNISNLTGNISYLTGDISPNLTGNISKLTGDLSNIRGNLDDCEITEEERKKGIDINDLVK